MDEKLRDALRRGRFDRTPEGIYVPDHNVLARGRFVYAKRGEPLEETENLVTDEGLDYILKAAVGETTNISNWYLALFTGAVTVLSTWTAQNFTSSATEWTAYTSASRPVWAKDAVADQTTDNYAAKAAFESTADAQIITGAALMSASGKEATTGTLMAAARLSSNKSLDTGEILDIGYGLTLSAV